MFSDGFLKKAQLWYLRKPHAARVEIRIKKKPRVAILQQKHLTKPRLSHKKGIMMNHSKRKRRGVRLGFLGELKIGFAEAAIERVDHSTHGCGDRSRGFIKYTRDTF